MQFDHFTVHFHSELYICLDLDRRKVERDKAC